MTWVWLFHLGVWFLVASTQLSRLLQAVTGFWVAAISRDFNFHTYYYYYYYFNFHTLGSQENIMSDTLIFPSQAWGLGSRQMGLLLQEGDQGCSQCAQHGTRSVLAPAAPVRSCQGAFPPDCREEGEGPRRRLLSSFPLTLLCYSSLNTAVGTLLFEKLH